MTKQEAFNELKSLGTAQNRKIYRRHGVGDELYGVSYANLEKLRKRVKVNHKLATSLWATGNHDARIFATMVADPSQLDSRLLDTWARDLDNYVVTDAFAGLVAKSDHARHKMEKWSKSKQEWVGRTGWLVLANLAMRDQELDDTYFGPYLKRIEHDIHTSKNRVRDAMNSALIAIGMRNGKLEIKAVATAKRIGKIDVDHGETGCKTPDAVEYIRKGAAHKKVRARKK